MSQPTLEERVAALEVRGRSPIGAEFASGRRARPRRLEVQVVGMFANDPIMKADPRRSSEDPQTRS